MLGAAAGARPVRADAAALIYSEGMAESLKGARRQGARPVHPAAGAFLLFKVVLGISGGACLDVPGRRRAGRGDLGALAPALGGVLRHLVLLRPLGRDDREDQGQLVLHLVPVGFCLPLLGTIAALLWRWEKDEPMRRVRGVRRDPAGLRPGLHALRQGPRVPEEVFRLSR